MRRTFDVSNVNMYIGKSLAFILSNKTVNKNSYKITKMTAKVPASHIVTTLRKSSVICLGFQLPNSPFQQTYESEHNPAPASATGLGWVAGVFLSAKISKPLPLPSPYFPDFLT